MYALRNLCSSKLIYLIKAAIPIFRDLLCKVAICIGNSVLPSAAQDASNWKTRDPPLVGPKYSLRAHNIPILIPVLRCI
jgi:hypothetical protein